MLFVELQGRKTAPTAHDGGLINISFSFIIAASSRKKIQDASVLSTIIVAQDAIKSTTACYHKAESPLADTTPVSPFAGLYNSVIVSYNDVASSVVSRINGAAVFSLADDMMEKRRETRREEKRRKRKKK